MRTEVRARVADSLAARAPGHPLRVAVDGITASGKTTWARELAAAVGERGRPVQQVSMDGFHHPRAYRHRQRDPARGYYEDAYDFAALREHVLEPLGPGGDRRMRTRVIDLATDEQVDEPPLELPRNAVVVVDGTFLQRETGWDVVVFVDTSFEVARERGATRDAAQFGGLEAARTAFEERYHAACHLYVEAYRPAAHADFVIANDDFERATLR